MSSKQIFTFTWQGLEIEVRYVPSWPESFERIYGRRMAHLEVAQPGGSPLPFTAEQIVLIGRLADEGLDSAANRSDLRRA